MWDWLTEALDTLTGSAKDIVSGIGQALEWVSGDSSSSGASDAVSAVAKTSPADVARLGAGAGFEDVAMELAPGVTQAATGAGAMVWTKAGLKTMLDDLAGWAEKNPKTMVALGSAAAALLKRNESNTTNEILRSHYASMDATAAGKLELEKATQQNAMTSGRDLNVKGLPATAPSGLITSNVDIPGGYNARRKRNTTYGAPS